MPRRRSRSVQTAVGYLRVSTDDQRLGLAAQREQIETFAAREGLQIVAWHTDEGVSGAANMVDRPGLLAALAALAEHRAGVLLVAKRDRLARDSYVAATVERAVQSAGSRVASADGTANGNTAADAFLRSILDATGAYERAMIAGRTRAALAVKKARGERTGNVPYGFKLAQDSVHVVEDSAEQAVIARCRSLSADGLSVRKIAAALAAAGTVGRTGQPLSHTQVHRLVSA